MFESQNTVAKFVCIIERAIVFVCFVLAYSNTYCGTTPLELKEYVYLSLQKRPELKIKKNLFGIEKMQMASTKASLLPNFSLGYQEDALTSATIINDGQLVQTSGIRTKTYNVSVNQFLPTGTTLSALYLTQKIQLGDTLISEFSQLGLNIRQSLLRGFYWGNDMSEGIWPDYSIQKYKVNQANSAIEEEILRLIFEAETLFQQVYTMQEIMNARNEAYNLSLEQVEIVKKKVDAGMLVAAELLQVEERATLRHIEYLNAKQDFESAKAKLVILVGDETLYDDGDVRVGLATPKIDLPEIISSEEIIKMVEQRSPQLRRLESQFRAHMLEKNKAFSSWLPKLDIEATYYPGVQDIVNKAGVGGSSVGLQQRNWSVGATLEMPLGPPTDWYQYKQKKLQLENVKLQHQVLHDSLIAEAIPLAKLTNDESLLINQAESQIKLAKSKLEFERKKFEAGLSTIATVLQYQSDLTQARVNASLLLAQQVSAMSRLNYLTGKSFEKYQIQFEETSDNSP